MYVETFNAPPWNDAWTEETAGKRLGQMAAAETFYGICAFEEEVLCGMVLGFSEQFYDGVLFEIKEFCVKMPAVETDSVLLSTMNLSEDCRKKALTRFSS